jgi:predicted DNA binding CopG/RHH family protein
MTKKKRLVPRTSRVLDAEETALRDAIGRADHKPKSLLTPARKKAYIKSARSTLNETRVKISLRIPETDLLRLKAKAMREGMPYQTLIGSILHKAVR